MIEYWDLYDNHRNKLNKVVKRGTKLNDGEYHLVVNAWIKNDNNEYLISKRSSIKTFAHMWECVGGSAVKGEDSLTAAIREVKEELDLTLKKEDGILIGSTLRTYPKCSDILDVWLFKSNVEIKNIKIQNEVEDVMWASKDVILKLYEEKKFEANAFFEEVLNYEA